jgi:alkylation response protein AidB-like acyl-CoA dehydrogenase
MDLTLSEPYQALQAEIRDFIGRYGDKSPKVGGGRKRPDQKTLDWQKRLVEHGYAGRTIPKEYGGFGAQPDVMAAAVIAGEFARANVYAGLTNQGISMLVPTLLELGTDEQKRQYVGPTIRGDIIWCQGYSEPNNGSDLANAQTKAELRDGHWIVNGQKIWTSSAHYADMIFLHAEPSRRSPSTTGCRICCCR